MSLDTRSSDDALEAEREAATQLEVERDRLAARIVARHYELHPELEARYGEKGRFRCLQDAGYHLSYLAQSMASGTPALFVDYVAWSKVMLASRGIPKEDLARNLEVMLEVVEQALPERLGGIVRRTIDAGLEVLPRASDSIPTFLSGANPLEELARRYLASLLRGDRQTASRLILDAADGGIGVRELYLEVFQKTQHEIGRLWQMNQISVAQEHFCTAATQMIMSQLYPRIFTTRRNGHTLVAACVAEDLHEIGARIVADFFEMDGWDTFYLGANTPTSSLIQTVCERKADVLAISATLTSHVRKVAETISTLRATAGCASVKTMVGGYPFNVASQLWSELGADAFARDASDAVAVANNLMQARQK